MSAAALLVASMPAGRAPILTPLGVAVAWSAILLIRAAAIVALLTPFVVALGLIRWASL